MQKSPIQLYSAAVCFMAVGVLSLSVGLFLYNAISVVSPWASVGPMIPLPMPVPPSDALFGSSGNPVPGSFPAGRAPTQPSPAEMADFQRRSIEQARQWEVTQSKQGMLRWAIAILVSGALFLIHWRLLNRRSVDDVAGSR